MQDVGFLFDLLESVDDEDCSGELTAPSPRGFTT
jgi:hypothetical protein